MAMVIWLSGLAVITVGQACHNVWKGTVVCELELHEYLAVCAVCHHVQQCQQCMITRQAGTGVDLVELFQQNEDGSKGGKGEPTVPRRVRPRRGVSEC